MAARDLSLVHEPVGNLFETPGAGEAIDRFRLTGDQITFFETNGYLEGIDILTPEQVAALRVELDEFFQPEHEGQELWYEYHSNESNDPNNVLFHALGSWRMRTAFHDVIWSPAFTVPASQLLGDKAVRFWHDQLFCKPAKHGGVVAWHQDYSYWTRTAPMNHLTCWIPLDDSDASNGAIQYVPGSHRWDLLPITGLAGDMDAIREVLDDEQWHALQNPVCMNLKAGQAAFHHPLTVHGSKENSTDRPRRVLVLNVIADGVASASDEPLLDGVPVFAPGEKLEGQFFPLLYSP